MLYEFSQRNKKIVILGTMKTLAVARPLPKFLQISELLIRQIRAGHFRKGERLPTEAALSDTLQVAIGTLRKALDVLEKQNVIERIQGSGTYVRSGGTGKSIYEFFRLELHHGPGLPSAHILSVEKMSRPADVPAFRDSAVSHVWRVRRLRFLNQTPVALEEIWFDGQQTRHIKASQLGESMYLFYQKNFNRWMSRVEDHIYAQEVPEWTVPQFGVQAHAMSGYIERLSWTADNALAEFSKTWFDPQLCRYASRISQ
jgi:GntR family transcriptional regulator